MRVMRKILKRKVGIVMAVLVILGIAVYGVSAFAEEQTTTTETFTINPNYIYLNPAGMNLGDVNWTDSNADIRLNVTGWDAKNQGKYDQKSGYWYWDASQWQINAGNTYFFTYGTDWSVINSKPYYRTEVSSDILTKGKVYAQNGTASTKIENQDVYALKEYTSNAGQSLSFVNMTASELSGVQAQFSLDGNYDDSASGQVTALQLSDGKVTVPNDVNGKAYQYVRFIDAQSKSITDSFDLATAISKGGILYYGIRQDSSQIYSEWSQEKKSETAPNVTKLYFNNLSFKTSDEITIQIGSGEPAKVGTDETATNTLSYSLSGNNIDMDTIISITKNGVTYRFYPNGTDNLITYSGSNICIKGTYKAGSPNTVYFDATLSKLSYAGDVADNSIPLKNGTIRYHAWNDTNDYKDGELTKLDNFSDGTHTWSDVYKAELDKKYSHILFYSSTDGNFPNDNANKTYDLNIPTNLTNPCFYADTSDDSIYKGTNRSGYWGELYTVRDAEGKTKDGATTTTSDTIVDIPSGILTRNSNMLYVNTTLYDYYSDYELNGYNRDGYSYNADLRNLGNNPNLHYIYQPFRQLDQALSSYYTENSASSPIYWGNFQNYEGSHYNAISGSLNLYGSNNWNKFIYENNSMWGRNGSELQTGNSAVQGLVADTLSDNNLMIKNTSGKTVAAPYFNEDFLTGNNSKNTVLGKVYKDVTFPFVKKAVTSSSYSGSVDYWYFNSADADADNRNLQLQQSKEDGYFLNPSDQAVKGQTADKGYPATGDNNYFPFNTSDQSGNATKLNYGFGQKFDLKFKLTSDGTVKTTEGADAPIEFNFSGDDDVWVFIDGKLVLDVGGGHGKVTGTINFKEKTATVSSVKNDDTTSGGVTTSKVKNFGDDKTIMKDYFTKEHTLTMFYMERGLWESNLSLSFNFPDENEFQVEKNVDTTDVAKDFKECFDNVSAFPFTILNQATHYAAKEATGGQEIKNITFNNTFKDNTIANVGDNTFAYLATCKDEADLGTAKSDVVHWRAELSDDGTYKYKRWGIIYPSSGIGNEFNATYTIGKSTTNHYKYLQFSLYDGVVTETPSLNNMYVELEDSNGTKIGGFLSAGNTYNSLNLKKGKWNTITIDLDKLSKTTTTFDYSKIVNIKFDYNLSRDMYLDDFTFIPSTEVTQPTGFVTKQYEIPDYGSVASGMLMYPVNAVYTVSSGSSSTTNLLGADGTFTLANGETATFEDQFRRGSYIALSEDVDTEVFEPSWTLYENGEEVKSTVPANSTTVTQAEQVTLPTQNGQALKDGRQEKYVSGKDSDGQEQSNTGYTIIGWAKKNGTTSSDADRDEKNTIVFRSFTDPDSSTTATKLKVKYTNKVRTGAIKIVKAGAYSSDTATTLDQEYQIKVTFTNIAGMALENGKKYEYTYSLKYGEHYDITGIPAGTEYTISEILPDDGSSLNDIAITQPDYNGDESKYTATKVKDSSGNWVIHGKIKAGSTAENTVFTFKNTKKPVINLTVVKNWTGTKNNTTLPDSVTVKLQRRVIATPENKWEDVSVTDSEGNETAVITLRPDNQNTANSWKYVFRNLDRYPDYTTSRDNPYEYRVVEVVKDGETYKELSTGEYFNDCFKVQSYNNGTNVSVDSSETSTKVDRTYTITNVYSPKTNIKITKVDASNSDVKLNDVQFTLEKLIPVSAGSESYEADTSFGTNGKMIAETSGNSTDNLNTPLGIAEFKDLPDGRYRLTETKAKAGYSLLKDPIIIVIDRTGTTIVCSEGESYDASKHNYTFGDTDDTKNTISLQISNRMKFLLPKTGGYGAMLFILCGMALATLGCLIFFLITLRKEVQYSRLKRQRRNAIGK